MRAVIREKIIPVAAACSSQKGEAQAGLGRKRHGKQTKACIGIDRVIKKNGAGKDCRRCSFEAVVFITCYFFVRNLLQDADAFIMRSAF